MMVELDNKIGLCEISYSPILFDCNVSKSITIDTLVIYAAFCIKKLYNIYMKHFIL